MVGVAEWGKSGIIKLRDCPSRSVATGREGPVSPERSEGYRREAPTRMPKASGHDFAKQKHGTKATGLPETERRNGKEVPEWNLLQKQNIVS